MATLQGKAVKNTYRQVLQIGANNVGVSGTAQRVQDGAGVNTALSLSTIAATIHGDLTITGDLIITGGGIQIQDLIDDTVATLIQNGTGITWAYNDGARTLTPTITIATADGGVQGTYLQLNTAGGGSNAVGKLKWNTTDGTMDIGLLGGNVVLQVGQEEVARVLNNSGTNFTEAGYQAVRITSAQGQRLAVGLAQGNNNANSKNTLGLVTENIANNQEGFITTSGLVRQIDTTGDLQTEVWVDGDTLYLSPTAPGVVTKVKPIAPQQVVVLGFVVYAHKTQGKIYVKVDNGYDLTELHDVKITSVANNNILKYNSSTALWENVAGTTTNISEGTNLYYTQARFDSAFAAKTTTNLTEGANLYFTTARGDANFATNFATKTTTNLPEGSNLYYTNTRARTALSITAGTGIDYNNTTGVFALSAIPNASLTNSSVTINSLVVALGSSITLTTTNIAEGTNLYWTDARFDTRFSTKTTTNLAEGSNLYYTQTRFNTAFTAKSTTDLAEGTNLYYTDTRSRAAISESAVGLDYSSGSGVLSLTAGYAIPTTVKLGQYDTAYNRSIVSAAVSGTTTKTLSLTQQDANVVSATWTDLGITTINGTANQITATTVANTTTLAFTNDVTMPNNLVVSGNLTINGTATYVNTQSISAKDPLFEVANDNNSTDVVDIGYYGRFYDSAQTRVEFTGLFRDASDAGKFKFFTGLVDEPTNVVNTTGTGYTVGTLVANFEGNLAGTANAANALSTARTIAASGDATWSVSFDGSANATAALTLANTGVTATTYGTSTAVPTIAIDGKGRITSASNTNIAFPVTTVNGASGTVVLTTTNIAEGTNQYFTTGRAQSAISLTTSGTSGAATYSGGVFNIPTYIGGSGTANEIAYFSTTGVISSLTTATYPSLTELSYVKGVTSGIQSQINTKAADNAVVHLAGTETITGAKTFSSSVVVGGTATSRKLQVNTSGNDGIRISTSNDNPTLDLMQTAAANAGARNWRLVTNWEGWGTLDFQSGTNSTNDPSTTRMTILGTTGYIGMGIGAPTYKLDVRGTYDANGIISVRSTDSAAINVGGVLGFGGFHNGSSNQSQWAWIKGAKENSNVNDNASYLSFATMISGGSPTERLRITSGGDLMVGTGTAAARLHVYTGDAGTVTSQAGTVAIFENSGHTRVQLQSPDTYSPQIYFSSPSYPNSGSIDQYVAAPSVAYMGLNQGGSERMRITGTGYAKHSNDGTYNNATGPYHEFTNTDAGNSNTIFRSTNASYVGDGLMFYALRNTTNNTFYALGYYNVGASAYKFRVADSGNVTNTNNSYGAISDIKLKENIVDASPKLDDLLKVKIKNFNYIGSNEKQLGVIAQELEEVFPSMIEQHEDYEEVKVTNEDGNITTEKKTLGTVTKSVKYSVFVPMLIKAIQELEKRVKELEAK